MEDLYFGFDDEIDPILNIPSGLYVLSFRINSDKYAIGVDNETDGKTIVSRQYNEIEDKIIWIYDGESNHFIPFSFPNYVMVFEPEKNILSICNYSCDLPTKFGQKSKSIVCLYNESYICFDNSKRKHNFITSKEFSKGVSISMENISLGNRFLASFPFFFPFSISFEHENKDQYLYLSRTAASESETLIAYSELLTDDRFIFIYVPHYNGAILSVNNLELALAYDSNMHLNVSKNKNSLSWSLLDHGLCVNNCFGLSIDKAFGLYMLPIVPDKLTKIKIIPFFDNHKFCPNYYKIKSIRDTYRNVVIKSTIKEKEDIDGYDGLF